MPNAASKKAPAELAAGDKAPEFRMPLDQGGQASLEAYAGKAVVLYFYPKDDTPGCTLEAKDFKEHIKAFERAGAVVVGVSKDPLASHAKFREKFCLPFPLASDETGGVCESYGVWVEKSMYGKKYMGIERATFLIDGKGIVRRVWRKVKVEGHVQEVLEAAKAIAYSHSK
jgi:peroxiredoxin Q/BCP